MDPNSRLLMLGSGGAVAEGWDLSLATYNGSPQNWAVLNSTNSQGVFFKPDGTKFYIAQAQDDVIEEYSMSSAWDVATASYVQNFSVLAQELVPRDVFFRSDGLKMYVTGSSSDSIHEYNLSTAWNISTASLLQSFSFSGQTVAPQGIFFKPDGTLLYTGDSTQPAIYEYALSSAWNISTASFSRQFVTPYANVSVTFKSDGTKMYTSSSLDNIIREHNLSTPWNISTSVLAQEANPSVAYDLGIDGFFIRDDGSKIFCLVADRLYSVDITSAWDVSTFSYTPPSSNYYPLFEQDRFPRGFAFKPDGTKMYASSISDDEINEYTLSTPWDISTASYIQSFSVVAQDTAPSALAFKSDGTKMYIFGPLTNAVLEYTLSTAWDISTAVYSQSFSVVTEEASGSGLYFRPDGSKMYLLGQAGDDVNEYNLSTAWDVSTASFVQAFSVIANNDNPNGIFFKPDGLKMFVVASANVGEYGLSSAWDVSTASFIQSFSVSDQDLSAQDIAFKNDGLKMYITGGLGILWSYDL